MSTQRHLYGTANQPIVITLASLANNALRQSVGISNEDDGYLDVLVGGYIKSGASTLYTRIWVYGSADGGVTNGGGASGLDAAFTDASGSMRKAGLTMLRDVLMPNTGITYEFGPFSLVAALGLMPSYWGIVIENLSGAAFDAVGAAHALHYQGVYQETIV